MEGTTFMLPRLLGRLSDTGVHVSGSPRPLCIRSTSTDCHVNLALEELLLRASLLASSSHVPTPSPRGPPMLCLSYVNAPCVVLGRNQNAFREAALPRIQLRRPLEEGFSMPREPGETLLARRVSGGGAVFHDTGNVNFCIYTHRDDYDPELTIQLLRLMLESTYNIAKGRLTTTPRHDLFLDGRKITGSAMRVGKHVAYHHFTLLVSTEMHLVRGWLAGAGKYTRLETNAVDSVRSPVTTLRSSVEGFRDDAPTVQQKMLDFVGCDGWRLFLELQKAKRASSRPCAVPVDIVGAPEAVAEVAEVTEEDALGAVFVYAPGDRPQRGDEATVAALVAKYRSVRWLLLEPGAGKFRAAVIIDLQERLAHLGAEVAASAAVLLAGGPPAHRMLVTTCVEHGKVAELQLGNCDERKGTDEQHSEVAPIGMKPSSQACFPLQDIASAALHGVSVLDLAEGGLDCLLGAVSGHAAAALSRLDVLTADALRAACGHREEEAVLECIVATFARLWAETSGFCKASQGQQPR